MQQRQSLMMELQPTQNNDEDTCFFSMEPLHSVWKGTMLLGNIVLHSLNPSAESAREKDLQELMVMLFLF